MLMSDLNLNLLKSALL